MSAKLNTAELAKTANDIRIGIIEALHAAGSGHSAGALGLVEMLTMLYFHEMNIDPQQPDMPDRDQLVLSPAHMVPGLYATLAERGFFPKAELTTLRKFGARLAGHTLRDLTIGIETTGGSLGQGISIACGFALAAKLEKQDYRTYCVISDGELNEGQTWEAFMFAAKMQLDNLCIILDVNGIQLSGNTADIMPTKPLRDKLEAFNLFVCELDGHDFNQIAFGLEKARLLKGKPSVVLSHTVAGKGISFMESKWEWHGKAPNDEEYAAAMAELKT